MADTYVIATTAETSGTTATSPTMTDMGTGKIPSLTQGGHEDGPRTLGKRGRHRRASL